MKLTTIDRIISESVADRRFYTTTTVAFACLALLLTATALPVIVIARAAVERRRELAIRTALGAPAGRLIALVARQGVIPGAVGTAAGLGAASFGTTILQRFLFGIEPREPLVYTGRHTWSASCSRRYASLPAGPPGRQSPAGGRLAGGMKRSGVRRQKTGDRAKSSFS